MGSLGWRVGRLEESLRASSEKRNLSREALRQLSDEDLEVLEQVLEDDLQRGLQNATFEELYVVSSEKSRRTMDAYFEAVDAWREGRELEPQPSRDPLGKESKNGYRIWQYRK